MLLSDSIRTELALDNESVQLQVSSDYNFHSEESFKLNYWSRVIEVVNFHGEGIAMTPSSLKAWWSLNVNKRSLVGINKVLSVCPGLILYSQISADYGRIYKSDFAGFSSVNSSWFGSAKRAAWTVWSLFRGAEEEGPSGWTDDELFLQKHSLNKFARSIIAPLQGLEPVVVTEDRILEILSLQGAQAPFTQLTGRQLTILVVTALVCKFGAVPFLLDETKCLKLPPSGENCAETPPVTEGEKAILMYELALEKLSQEETVLAEKWEKAEQKVNEHLRAGRKPLALAALKERKLIEKRIENLHVFKLKLEESTSLTQTAIMQQTVVNALTVGAAATRAVKIAPATQIAELMHSVEEMQDEINSVTHALGSSTPEDSDVLNEYEEMLAKHSQDTRENLVAHDAGADNALVKNAPAENAVAHNTVADNEPVGDNTVALNAVAALLASIPSVPMAQFADEVDTQGKEHTVDNAGAVATLLALSPNVPAQVAPIAQEVTTPSPNAAAKVAFPAPQLSLIEEA